MNQPAGAPGLFRTLAWAQSWVDIWGTDPRIKLLDLGGRSNPLEMMYLIDHKLKGVVPVKSLVIAGYGFADFDPPRAEYNSLDALLQMAGGFDPLMKELLSLSWNQWVLTDFFIGNDFDCKLKHLAKTHSLYLVKAKSENAYRIAPVNFDHYKQQLSASTRAKYFNRRSRLAEQGSVELIELTSATDFFRILNQFHVKRWGRPCYSLQSMEFFALFIERIRLEGGKPIMQCLSVADEIVSVLFDIVWQGMRYNLQSGYFEGRYGNLALGSLHLGFAIEQALTSNYGYDFLAGSGMHANYKENISTKSTALETCYLAQGWLKRLYQIYGK
jgi:hypothetical protein